MNSTAKPSWACSASQLIQQLLLHHHVQRRGRFVQDQQRRAQRQGDGDHRPLAHAARQLVGVTAGPRPGPAPPGHSGLGHPGAHLGAGTRLVRGDGVGDLGRHGQQRVERVHAALGDQRQPAGRAPPAARRSSSASRSRPSSSTRPPVITAGGSSRRGSAWARRGLAAARFAHQAETFARRDVERHAVHRPHRPVVQPVLHRQVARRAAREHPPRPMPGAAAIAPPGRRRAAPPSPAAAGRAARPPGDRPGSGAGGDAPARRRRCPAAPARSRPARRTGRRGRTSTTTR